MKPAALARGLRRPSVLIGIVAAAVVVAAFGWMGRAVSAGPAEGTTFAGPAAAAAPPAGPFLRLATFNIDGGQGTDDRVDLGRTAKCLQRIDVAAMEEVHATSNADNQAEPLAGLLHLSYLFAPAEQRWGHDTFGNAVFTDLPVTHWRRFVLPSRTWHAKRNYVAVDLTWLDRTLHVIATHVDYKANGDEQLGIVIRAFLDAPAPAVLLGDLNHPASSPQIKQLIATPGVEECVSQKYDVIPGRVDWIFVRGLRTDDAGQVDLHASDHPAYWAEVHLPAAPMTTAPRRTATTR